MNDAIWISWENHRRSCELAKRLMVDLRVINIGSHPLLNPILPAIRTLLFLAFQDYKVILVQNPSLILTSIACLLKPLKHFIVVQDLHSYFIIHIDKGVGFRGKIYRFLSRFCIQKCDLTIVTNDSLKEVVEEIGGKGFVLQDAIPELDLTDKEQSTKRRVVFICTYAADEPYMEVIEAGRVLMDEVDIFITGNPSKAHALLTTDIPENVKLTGFLSERDYVSLLSNADAIIDLTTLDNCLVCGAYEAVALEKPLITSNTRALKDYFTKGTIFSDNDKDSLARNIREVLKHESKLKIEMKSLKWELVHQWSHKFERLKELINSALIMY